MEKTNKFGVCQLLSSRERKTSSWQPLCPLFIQHYTGEIKNRKIIVLTANKSPAQKAIIFLSKKEIVKMEILCENTLLYFFHNREA